MTQLQKYNGENHYNNKVVVNYRDRTIKFVPVAKRSIIIYYITFLISLQITFTIMWIYGICAPLALLSYIYDPAIYLIVPLLPIIKGIYIAIFFYSLIFFNKKWKENYFPKANAGLKEIRAYSMWYIPFIYKKEKNKKIRINNLYKNFIIIPSFDNIELKYKLYGDFKKNIKNIVINNHFHENDTSWYCIFEFKRRPKKGYMEVEYQ